MPKDNPGHGMKGAGDLGTTGPSVEKTMKTEAEGETWASFGALPDLGCSTGSEYPAVTP